MTTAVTSNPTAPAGLTVQTRPIADLRPHPLNYRRHPEAQLEVLRRSLRDHGLQKPVVVTPDGTILAGHGLVEAAQAEGWEEIAVHIYDGPHPDAFVVADNYSASLAVDDEQALADLLRRLEADGELSASGYQEDDLAELIARLEAEEKSGRE
jgi:ParB-like chromosome segregation protein Spo0J